MNTYETETNENITKVDQDCSFELRSCLAFDRLSTIFDLSCRKCCDIGQDVKMTYFLE